MNLHATGHLAHHFWGEYSASLGLAFDTPESAKLALPQLQIKDLGTDWRIADKNARVVVIGVNSAQLDRVKERLGKFGADTHAIDSVDHSVDYGDPFTVDIQVEDPRQLTFA